MVSEASSHVTDYEKRHGFILNTLKSRNDMPRILSKKTLIKGQTNKKLCRKVTLSNSATNKVSGNSFRLRWVQNESSGFLVYKKFKGSLGALNVQRFLDNNLQLIDIHSELGLSHYGVSLALNWN